ncbi:hypothetical protein HDU99_008370 [Rhizoclosmatium hyalinum]|nr:hypothetical protein HDU99_008370 [Rhizoclosmatium hyalinum]
MATSSSSSSSATRDEVQVMPGVYLTTFAGSSAEKQKQVDDQKGITLKTVSGIDVDLDVFDSENAEILQQEIARLRLSVQKLLESNHLLKEFSKEDPDPEYALAISENVQVIDKRLRMIKTLMQKLAAVTQTVGSVASGPCHAELTGLPIPSTQTPTQPTQPAQQPQSTQTNHPQEQVQAQAQEEAGVYL